jgi:hypothetical protein
MFKFKKTLPKLCSSRETLLGRIKQAETAVEKLRVSAVKSILTETDPAARTQGAKVHQAETELSLLREALVALDAEIATAEERERVTADNALRETTAAALNAMADRIERATIPLTGSLDEFRNAFAEIGDILGAGGTMLPFLDNLREQLPASAMFHVEELRTRAQAVLDGNAPPCLPAKPDLAIIENGQPLMEKSPWHERGRPSGPVRLPEIANPDLAPSQVFQEYSHDPPISHISFPKGAEPEPGLVKNGESSRRT